MMSHRDIAEQLYQHVEDVFFMTRDPVVERLSVLHGAFKRDCIEGFVKLLKLNIPEPEPKEKTL